MKNTVFQVVAPKAPTVIPPPPGGGSWRFDGVQWQPNTTPRAEPELANGPRLMEAVQDLLRVTNAGNAPTAEPEVTEAPAAD